MSDAVFNPSNRPLEELPFIYGFNNGGDPDFLIGVLLAQDGTCLGSHCCSHEGFMRGDLGVDEGSRPDRHEHFKAHYPDGYRMAFVRGNDVATHDGLNKAVALHHQQAKEREATP